MGTLDYVQSTQPQGKQSIDDYDVAGQTKDTQAEVTRGVCNTYSMRLLLMLGQLIEQLSPGRKIAAAAVAAAANAAASP